MRTLAGLAAMSLWRWRSGRRRPHCPIASSRSLSTAVHPSRAERAQLLRGNAITRFIDADASQEVAIFGAVWIDAPRQRYADAVMEIERSSAAARSRKRFPLPASGFRLPASGFRLPASGFRLPASGFRLQLRLDGLN